MKNKFLKISIFLSFLLFSNNSFAVLKFKSSDIKKGKQIGEAYVYNGFGCSGENKAPKFEITAIPEGTKSLAMTMYDPDAPTGSGWWHWIVYNIDPKTKIIGGDSEKLEGEVSIGRNDYGNYDYGGPCPPEGTLHNYIFTLYALNVKKLDVSKNASAALIGYNLNAYAIQKKEFRAKYRRKKASRN